MRICLQLINKPIACLPHIICIVLVMNSTKFVTVAFSLENRWMATMIDNFRMNTGYGRYGAAYNMVGISCFNEELSLLPKNPTEAKLQATSTWGESTEPTKGVMKHTYKVVLYNYCLMQYCCILFYQLVSREGCNPNQWEKYPNP
jgi:hypothetical protein